MKLTVRFVKILFSSINVLIFQLFLILFIAIFSLVSAEDENVFAKSFNTALEWGKTGIKNFTTSMADVGKFFQKKFEDFFKPAAPAPSAGTPPASG